MKSNRKYRNPLTFQTDQTRLWADGCAKDHKTGIIFCWWLHMDHPFCPYGCEEVEENDVDGASPPGSGGI